MPTLAATPRLTWDNVEGRKKWSEQLLASVAESLPALESADVSAFAPRYSDLDPVARLRFWGEFFVAMSWYESAWDPRCVYHEPPPLSVDSIGLLQLSYEDARVYDLEPLDPRDAEHSLKNPVVNLRCGVAILARLVARDHVVTQTSGRSHRGGARYWSVLRPRRRLKQIRRWVLSTAGLLGVEGVRR